VLEGLASSAQIWTVRLEEPTGIERRDGEIVRVPLSRLADNRSGFQVVDSEGRALPWQVSGDALLFPASVVPGQRPEYRIECCGHPAPSAASEITARRAGQKVELANSRFRVIVDLTTGAIVEGYNLTAGPQRVLNLVETTPVAPDKNDIQGAPPPSHRPVSPITGENGGWTSLGGAGGFDRVEFAAAGPLEARVILERKGERWELSFAAGSGVLRWRASKGFRFAAVSALPYLPFDRFVDGSEYLWPSGPGSGEPPDHSIGARSWTKPAGGHFAYYARRENYGALGVVSLDHTLEWAGAGTSRFEGRGSKESSEVAITFPRWHGDETVLEARREARILRQPLLVEVEAAQEGALEVRAPLARRSPPRVEKVASVPPEWNPPHVALDGEWELAWGEKGAGPQSEWRKVKVPGSVHLQWLPQEQIYAPEAAWVCRKEWWYRKRIQVPAAFGGKRLRLEFGATDYYADLFVDGQRAGRHEGYIDPWSADVTAFMKPGAEHEIRVRVWTPVHYYWKHRPYTVKGAYGAVDQKPDDITAFGITRGLRLAAYSGPRILDVAVDTRLRGSEADVHVELESGEADDAHWELALAPRNFQGAEVVRVSLAAEGQKTRATIPVQHPRLWATWDVGRPNLYTLDARLVSASGDVLDARRLTVGIREIERIGWKFYLNGRRLFLRGTNSYYNLFMSEMDHAAYERDFALIRQMNVNLIRIHCHFQNPEFYDLADEQGLLIWQDFLEAWYPEDTAFSLHAAALYDNHIRYVRNRPSVAAWAASDEESHENYRDLTKHLAARASLLDPQLRWVQRSTGRYGDAHLYHGWYGGTIWDYRRMEERLVTELGATSLPHKESLDRFLPGAWPIKAHAARWRYHRLQIEEAESAWGKLDAMTPGQTIARSQDYAARLFQIAIEQMRRRKEEAGGIFHFFTIDIWPSATMAAIDFYRRPMKVFDTVRRSFEPVAAVFDYERDVWKRGETVKCEVWGVNDRWEAAPGARIDWSIEDEAGKPLATGSLQHSFGADEAKKAGEVSWRAAGAGSYRLRAEVHAGGRRLSENVYEFLVRD
jgi:beta-mannosidase